MLRAFLLAVSQQALIKSASNSQNTKGASVLHSHQLLCLARMATVTAETPISSANGITDTSNAKEVGITLIVLKGTSCTV